LRGRRDAAGIIRRQFGVLLAATLVPVGVHVVYLAGLSFGGVDPNPYALVLAALILAWGFLDSRLWDIVPVARQAVLAGLRDAVIVIDDRGRVADLNPGVGPLTPRRSSSSAARGRGAPVIVGDRGLLEAQGSGSFPGQRRTGTEVT
jgi:hypothetical protein